MTPASCMSCTWSPKVLKPPSGVWAVLQGVSVLARQEHTSSHPKMGGAAGCGCHLWHSSLPAPGTAPTRCLVHRVWAQVVKWRTSQHTSQQQVALQLWRPVGVAARAEHAVAPVLLANNFPSACRALQPLWQSGVASVDLSCVLTSHHLCILVLQPSCLKCAAGLLRCPVRVCCAPIPYAQHLTSLSSQALAQRSIQRPFTGCLIARDLQSQPAAVVLTSHPCTFLLLPSDQVL